MNKMIVTLFLIVAVMTANEDTITYSACETEVNRIGNIEDFIRLNEYVSDEKAIEQFEKVNQGQVKVLMEMPFTLSHSLGKVEEGMLVLHYTNVREKPHKDFIVHVIKNTANTLNEFIRETDEIQELSNGKKMYYRTEKASDLHLAFFELDDYLYIFGGADTGDLHYTISTFNNMAESIID